MKEIKEVKVTEVTNNVTEEVVVGLVKDGLHAVVNVGAGIVLGLAAFSVPGVAALTGALKLVTSIGIVAMADAAGDIAGSQAEKRVDEARDLYRKGVKFGEVYTKISEESK